MIKDKIKYENLVSDALQGVLNPRTRNILSLRFGLNDGQRRTLEAIGQRYGITRERVRQIEKAAFFELSKSKAVKSFNAVYSFLNDFFQQHGGVIREDYLLSSATQANYPNPSWGALYFVLSSNGRYQRYVESDKFYPLWIDSKSSLKKAEKVIDQVSQILEQRQRPLTIEEINNLIQQSGINLDQLSLQSYLNAAKGIAEDGFGYYGFVRWPEINPRGAKDKAYLVLKKEKQPLHFSQVAGLINQVGLGKNPAQAQTVHNELIKDDRFVLVGRGTYALREWGYQPGTVKQVIASILKKYGPLTKEEIVEKVRQIRLVKENTILINLQNKNYFNYTPEGKYTLTK